MSDGEPPEPNAAASQMGSENEEAGANHNQGLASTAQIKRPHGAARECFSFIHFNPRRMRIATCSWFFQTCVPTMSLIFSK